jgi:outer membrane lipoprotein
MCIFLFSVAFLLGISGCATGVSKRSLSLVNFHGTFSELQNHPDFLIGKVALLGGKVIETKSSSGHSEITVLQVPLGTGNQPLDTDRSAGRFLVRANRFLDPAIYQKGTLLTVVGKIVGSEQRLIGSFNYRYPVLALIDAKAWRNPQPPYSNVHFGIGVGVVF